MFVNNAENLIPREQMRKNALLRQTQALWGRFRIW